jgi:hypothetical protein
MGWFGKVTLRCAVWILSATACVSAQVVISARAGLIYCIEGEVLLNGVPLNSEMAGFRLLKRGSELRTLRGRAEIILHSGELPYPDSAFVPKMVGGNSPLLRPGAAVRLGDSSALRLLDNRLESPRFELVAGSAVLDVGGLPRGTIIAAEIRGAKASVSRSGLYRLDADSRRISVYRGEAKVTSEGRLASLSAGTRLRLEGPGPEPFDVKAADSLDRWNQRRAGVLSQSNLAVLKKQIRPSYRTRRRLP